MPERMKEMTRCIQERDFPAFAQLTMKDSNQFHATCLDTFPPISYLNDTSRRIIQLVHGFNTHHGQTKVTACRGCGADDGDVVYMDKGYGSGWGWEWLQDRPPDHGRHGTDKLHPTVLVRSMFCVFPKIH